MDHEVTEFSGKPETSYSLTVRKIALETGKFYNSLIDLYLGKVGESVDNLSVGLVQTLPPHLGILYTQGLGRLQAELAHSHNLMVGKDGKEVEYLFGEVLKEQDKMFGKLKAGVFRRIKSSKAKFFEPYPGVLIVESDPEFYKFLAAKEIVQPFSRGSIFLSESANQPTFTVVQKRRNNEGLDQNSNLAQEADIRHEFHHLIWHFLTRSGFVRATNEFSPEANSAFKHLRDELAGYIVEGRYLDWVDAYSLIYTTNEILLSKAEAARDTSHIGVELAKLKNISPSLYLYAMMSSRNFSELEDKVIELMPIDLSNLAESFKELYFIWSHRNGELVSIERVVKDRELKAPDNLGLDLINEQLRSSGQEIDRLHPVFQIVRQTNEFLAGINATNVPVELIIGQVLKDSTLA